VPFASAEKYLLSKHPGTFRRRGSYTRIQLHAKLIFGEKTMRRTLLTAAFILSFPAMALAQATAPNPKAQPTTVPNGAILSYNVIGLKLTNGANENVGEIKDLVMENGKLDGYIVSVGGFLGMGERYIDLTPSSIAIKYDAADKEWKGMINANKDELKAAPEFKYEGKFKH
jgi:hypothetical protein